MPPTCELTTREGGEAPDKRQAGSCQLRFRQLHASLALYSIQIFACRLMHPVYDKAYTESITPTHRPPVKARLQKGWRNCLAVLPAQPWNRALELSFLMHREVILEGAVHKASC